MQVPLDDARASQHKLPRRTVERAGSAARCRADITELLDACDALLVQRAAIEHILAELGPSFRETRAALNELAPVVGAEKR